MALPGIAGKLASWISVVYISTAIIRLILLADSNKRVYNHTPGPCRIVQGINNGSAGIEFVPELQLAFITSGLSIADGAQLEGQIFTYEFKAAHPEGQEAPRIHEATPLKLQRSDSLDLKRFVPLGISAYTSKGRVTLYIVNAHPEKQCVEVFTFLKEKSTAQHRKSICDSAFSSLFDIAVVGADRFFVSNLAFTRKGTLQAAELAMMPNLGSVLLFDGKAVSSAVRWTSSPTGLHYDEPRSRLIVSSLINEVLGVFTLSRDLSLTHQTDISLLSSPAGVYVEPKSGDIIAALHPVLHSIYGLWSNPLEERARSPSQVLRIRIQEDGTSWVITEPYANDGATISGSNAVAFVNDQLLIGSLYSRALLCDVDYPQLA